MNAGSRRRRTATPTTPIRLRSRRAGSRQRTRTPVLVGLAATVLASLLISVSPAGAATPEATASKSAGRSDIGVALNEVVAAGVPGIIARIHDPGRPARSYATGVADLAVGAALRPTAEFRIGSITKTFVATIVLQLVGEGRLTLDETVAQRLPGLLTNGDRITVRQLLNHTSGLPNYSDDPELFAGIVQNRIWAPRELVALAQKRPQQFTPGSAWSYSNTNYIVAGLLIEAVAGRPLGRELDRRIFSPLRLDHTSFPVANAPLSGYHAHGYISTEMIPTADGQPLDVTGYNPSHAWAAGAIVSNAEDLSDFYEALMGGRLLTPRLLREMQTTVAQDPTDPNTNYRYGLGLERVSDTCGANWGHTGSIYGYQDMAYWNSRTGRTVVIASNVSPAPAAAEAPLATAIDLALCADTSSSRPHRHLPFADGPARHP
jgi:D-alanyl-D-alanine carboxypeptidase